MGFAFNGYNLEPCQRDQMYLLLSGDLVMSINNPHLGFSEEAGAIISGMAGSENSKH